MKLSEYAESYWQENGLPCCNAHVEWYDAIEEVCLSGDRKSNLSILAPREFGKTCTVMTAMRFLRKNHPELKIRYVTHNQQSAEVVMQQMGEDGVGIDFVGLAASGNEPFDVVFYDDAVSLLNEPKELPDAMYIGCQQAQHIIVIGTPWTTDSAWYVAQAHSYHADSIITRIIGDDGSPSWPGKWDHIVISEKLSNVGWPVFTQQYWLLGWYLCDE